MRTVALAVQSNGSIKLISGDVLARAGEKNATTLTVDVSEWAETLATGVTYSIILKRSDEAAYPILSSATPTDGVLSVGLNDTATAVSGTVEVQVWAEKTDYIEKSALYRLHVDASLDSGSTPTGFNAWIQEIQDAASGTAQVALDFFGYGVISGLIVSAQETPNMTVAISAGVAYLSNGTRLAPSAVVSQAITVANATNPRIDIVYLSASGAITYLAGTAAATPSAPAVPTGGLLLAVISVAANATSIPNSAISDRRKSIYSDEWADCTLQNGATGTAIYRRIAGMLIELVFTITVSSGNAGVTQATIPIAPKNNYIATFSARNLSSSTSIYMRVDQGNLQMGATVTAGVVVSGSVLYPNI